MTTILLREQEIRNRIIELIRDRDDGLTITEISKILNIHYTTASKYLAVMEAEKKVRRRNIGMAKLFILNDSVVNLENTGGSENG